MKGIGVLLVLFASLSYADAITTFSSECIVDSVTGTQSGTATSGGRSTVGQERNPATASTSFSSTVNFGSNAVVAQIIYDS